METLLSHVVIVAAVGFLVTIIFSGIRGQCRVDGTDREDEQKPGWRGYSRDRS